MNKLSNTVSKAVLLPDIPVESVTAYSKASSSMLDAVNAQLKAHLDIESLLGGGPFSLLEDNHRNHVSFMAEVMSTNDFQLLAETLPWVYRAYHSQGIDYAYFVIELNAWIDVLHNELDQATAEPVIGLYRWMLAEHDNNIELSTIESEEELPSDDVWTGQRSEFMKALAVSDHHACLTICRQAKEEGITLPLMFQWIIFPAMVEVGVSWEHGKLSVAEEHAATAIVNKVLSALYFDADIPRGSRGSALVSASPNERHEMGAWMVATCLELDGWSVFYIGADVPAEDIVEATIQREASLVALSVAMPFNLGQARSVIDKLRKRTQTREVKIMLGGGVFLRFPFLANDMDADACLNDCVAAMEWARDNC